MVEEEIEQDQEETARVMIDPSIIKIIIITIVFSLLLVGGAVGATVYLVGDKNESTSKNKSGNVGEADEEVEEVVEEEIIDERPRLYATLDPKFVVSFNDQSNARFMQFSIDIAARERMILDQVDTNVSAVRSSLLLLFSSQEYEVVSTRAGKEQLLVEVTDDINNTLDELTGLSGVEATYFTSFIIQ